MWNFTGSRRPDFAIEPAEGQESVWDYPRPPAVRDDTRAVEVVASSGTLVSTRRSIRICETASPPTFYFHPDDVNWDLLIPTRGSSFCEWKGAAAYWALEHAPDVPVAWTYPDPSAKFRDYAGWASFYPSRVDCHVDGERVIPQTGGFYGGWITSDVVGPFKGDPGTGHW